ncbi:MULTISPECIES: hypothetical protein [Giesbergeria]|uniref:Uncharacterized protein n=1 Tax=Giesbergeria sinuosa TaxID=80883 RepID=A0ABV9QL35_9BURK
MKLWKKILIGVFALILLCIGGLYLFIQSLPDMCSNVVLAEYLSPNNKLKVVTFQRDCGATTGFSTQVLIISSADALENESGNTFIADTNHDAAPIGQGGGPEVQINWLSDLRLQIQNHKLARIFRAETKYEGVNVEYVHF